MSKQLQIRNSTAEFLIFQAEDKAQGVQVFYQDENIWATQDAIATLFNKGRTTISEHLKHIYQTGELDEQTTCRKFRHMGATGQEYETKYYNLDAIISVGYRVNSIRATQFRRWATSVLRQFFQMIQNELEDMGNIVSAVLDFAEARAKRHIPMTMEDWAKRIDAYLNSDERPLLTDAGSVSHEAAQEYAETEFEKYRIVQDRLFESDFDRFALPTLPFEDNEENDK